MLNMYGLTRPERGYLDRCTAVYVRTTYRRPPEVQARIYALYAMVCRRCQRKDPRLEGVKIGI